MRAIDFFNPDPNNHIHEETKIVFARFLKEVNLYEQYRKNLYTYQKKKSEKLQHSSIPRRQRELSPTRFIQETPAYYWLSRAFFWNETTEGLDPWATLNLLWGAKLITLFNNQLTDDAKTEVADCITAPVHPSVSIVHTLKEIDALPTELKKSLNDWKERL